MCGFLGFSGERVKSLYRDVLPRSLQRIKNRGPDQDNCLYLQNHNLWLGHNRLSILDLSEASKQPFSKNHLHIVFNGEIYNFLELKAILQGSGHSFVTASDTEVILEAYRKWGFGCFEKFNGFWSLAIFDETENLITLSRDRLGRTPLFFSFINSSFAFASEMKCLMPFLEAATPSREILTDPGAYFFYESTEKTLVKQISRLPPASYGVLRNGLLTIEPYWRPAIGHTRAPGDYEAQTETFREIFLDSCRLRMRSDVPVGTSLSGGLDSSSVLAAIKNINLSKEERCAAQPSRAFCMRFPGSFLDESEDAKKTAECLGVSLTTCECSGIDALKALPNDTYRFEEVYITSISPMMALYKTIADHGIRVTLDGHGADEIFGGYISDILYALVDANFRPASVKRICETIFAMQHPDKKKPHQYLYGLRQTISHRKKLKKLKLKLLENNFFRALQEEEKLDALGIVLFDRTFSSILPTLLRNFDRASMASGVEIRMPFLDHRIIEFAFSIPWTSKIRNGYSKAIVRDSMSPFLPTSVTRRRKKIGFNSPFSEWMSDAWKQYLSDTLASREFRESDLVDHKICRSIWAAVAKSKKISFYEGERFWSRLAPFFWEKYFYKVARQA